MVTAVPLQEIFASLNNVRADLTQLRNCYFIASLRAFVPHLEMLRHLR